MSQPNGTTSSRLRELDFLRGVAIVLVLMNHLPLFSFTMQMGWIGVDLFFVLSGFLVSGLLFKEYQIFGNIKPLLFLIRRGFKIYPIYYLFYIPYLLLKIYNGDFKIVGFISDMTFTQNYIWGFGFAYPASWSLAVEEHFYFGLVFIILLFFQHSPPKNGGRINYFLLFIVGCMVTCLLLRIFFLSSMTKLDYIKIYTPTHFRIDSLCMGVLISYFYYFYAKQLKDFYHKNKSMLVLFVLIGLSWTPFIDRNNAGFYSYLVLSIGLTLVYLSFGCLLLIFLFDENINEKLNQFATKKLVNLVSAIGFCSYSIYVIHALVIEVIEGFLPHNSWISMLLENSFIYFIGVGSLIILIGMLMTYTIENWFLRLRNQYFPSRV